MNSGGSFDWTSLYNVLVAVGAAVIILVAAFRVIKKYVKHEDVTSADLEKRGKGYLSLIADAAIALVLLGALRAILGVLTSLFQGQLGIV